ncbi:hypothetical protein [Bradyrhizobium liaoningense]
MAEQSTASVLQNTLTEHGLARALARQDVSPEFVRAVSVEEAARHLQRQLNRRGVAKKAKASRKKGIAYVPKAKKTKMVARSAVRQVQPNYWRRVKTELHLLICTSDRKYATLRKHLGKEGRTTQVAIVSSISAAIGAIIGASAAVIGPFVTLGLMALLQVGSNAWCTGQVE